MELMSPIKIIKLLFFWHKAEGILKEKNTMSITKFSQIVALLVQVLGSIGAASYVQTAVAGNSTTLTVITWVAAVLNAVFSVGHALLPALFTTTTGEVK